MCRRPNIGDRRHCVMEIKRILAHEDPRAGPYIRRLPQCRPTQTAAIGNTGISPSFAVRVNLSSLSHFFDPQSSFFNIPPTKFRCWLLFRSIREQIYGDPLGPGLRPLGHDRLGRLTRGLPAASPVSQVGRAGPADRTHTTGMRYGGGRLPTDRPRAGRPRVESTVRSFRFSPLSVDWDK